MKIVISPAKSLDYESELPTDKATQPRFLDEAETLNNKLIDMSKDELRELMDISQNLADLNYERYQKFSTPFTEDNARPCIYAFNGSAYKELDAYSIDDSHIDTLQDSLRILSGMYGLLRPLDLMQPYRLEMGTKLPTEHGKDLYSFWGDTITDLLNRDLRDEGSGVLVNLASNEYAKAVNMKGLDAEVIEPVFQDEKNGQYKIISFSAKKARGLMAAWIIRNHPRTEAELSGFAEQGYAFAPEVSEPGRPVFRRSEAARGAA